MNGTVVGIRYDPNRTAYIALISYMDGDKRYILAQKASKVGDTVVVCSGNAQKVKPGQSQET